jgi:hypothetical protein
MPMAMRRDGGRRATAALSSDALRHRQRAYYKYRRGCDDKIHA